MGRVTSPTTINELFLVYFFVEIINFFVSLTPFWAVPAMVISAQMGWTFKKRSKKSALKMAIITFTIATLCLVFFIWSGSPKKAKKKMSETFYMFEN